MEPRVVLVAGSTGLVGSECVRQLAADAGVAELRALVRREPAAAAPERVRSVIVDYDRLDRDPDLFRVDQVFCALGSTIRKAGSQAAFRRIDFEYPLSIARMTLAAGATHFLLVSSLGANAESGNFYACVKGELEDAIIGLGFRSVTIARPSFLLGRRQESRPAESVGRWLGRMLPARFRSVPARRVAAALVREARADRPGIRILENTELLAAG